MCHGGRGSVHEGAFGAENGDVSCDWGSGVYWGSEVFVTGRGDKDIVGVNDDIFMEWGEKEGVENLLSYLGGSGRHRQHEETVRVALSFIMLVARVFFGACSGGFRRSLRSGSERTFPTLEPKSLLMEGNLSIVRGIEGFGVFHGSKI